jgi:hypothetical protein
MTQTFEQYGAEEACWAHNPKVGGSKPPTATHFLLYSTSAHFIIVAYLALA